MNGSSAPGQIVTFYSYKGGVGRTMAVANVAFLAAISGKRVLIMDWDLEAPGLEYYFRGLAGTRVERKRHDAPGILDILWRWRVAAHDPNPAMVTHAFEMFQDGVPFNEAVRAIEGLPNDVVPGGCLDFIGAGRQQIATPRLQPYEDALSTFSWSDFFEKEAGGVVLEALRNWSKSKYDIILIDSRTGMADVSGICTMQLPDTVALCFVQNQQNIDGVSKVAGAIRRKRGSDVILRAVPMRTARSETAEEADARARAITALSRVGGFRREIASEEMVSLAVNAAENVPFLESLAPVVWQDAALDPLTLNYLRLSNQLFDTQFSAPSFSKNWLASVRRRLKPTQATSEYLEKLIDGDSERAGEEMLRLIESAYQAYRDGVELDVDYIDTLFESATIVSERPDARLPDDFYSSSIKLADEVMLTIPSSGNIKNGYSRFVQSFGVFASALESLEIYRSVDHLLNLLGTEKATVRRIRLQRGTALRLIGERDFDVAAKVLSSMRPAIEQMLRWASIDEPQIYIEYVDALGNYYRALGKLQHEQGKVTEAVNSWQEGLHFVKTTEASYSKNKHEFSTDVQLELISELVVNGRENLGTAHVAELAIDGIRLAGAQNILWRYLAPLSAPILSEPIDDDQVCRFVVAALSSSDLKYRDRPPHFFWRNSWAVDFVAVLVNLAKVLTVNVDHASSTIGENQRNEVVTLLVRAVVGAVLRIMKAIKDSGSWRRASELNSHYRSLMQILQRYQIDPQLLQETLMAGDLLQSLLDKADRAAGGEET